MKSPLSDSTSTSTLDEFQNSVGLGLLNLSL